MVPDFDYNVYKAQLYARRNDGIILLGAEIEIGDWKPVEHACHANVATLCTHRPEFSPVRGWLYFDWANLLPHVRFTAHSVVRHSDGQLYDITPSQASQPYPFIVASESDEEFVKNIIEKNVVHLDYQK